MVSPDTIRTAIGIIGNGTALVLFLSPVPTFCRIWKKGTVEQYSPIPYVATLLNCLMWVLHGLPAVHPRSMLVITINGTGTAIELAYITLFLLYSTGATRRKVLLLLAPRWPSSAPWRRALVLTLAHTHERRSMVVGILCVLFGTGMYAAPLSVMKMVIQTKSVEYMPLFLSLASLVNGICWTAYALIRFDLYITKMVIQTKSVEYMPLFLSLASLVNGTCWTAYALIRFDLYITKMVIQTKSVEYMPLFLSLASLVNGICWMAYTLIRFDRYLPHGPI